MSAVELITVVGVLLSTSPFNSQWMEGAGRPWAVHEMVACLPDQTTGWIEIKGAPGYDGIEEILDVTTTLS